MNHREQETEFLRRMLSREESAERQHLQSQLDEAEQRLRCVRRASKLVTVILALSAAGVGYGLIFLPGIIEHRPHFLLRFLYTVATGCLISLAIYAIDWLWQCHLAGRLRERCRRFVLEHEPTQSSQADFSETGWSLPNPANRMVNFSRQFSPLPGERGEIRAP